MSNPEELMSGRDKSLKGTRDKRQRVQRIKMGIILTILISIAVSLIAVVFLIIKVFSLQSQVNELKPTTALTKGPDEGEPTGDSSGNADGTEINKGDDKTKVYLTFDDGPSKNTNEILDILKKYNVKATFFVIGKDDPESIQAYKRIVDEGHSLGMHSYTHKYSQIYSSLDAFKNDVTTLQNHLEGIVGFKPTLYRFPGGSSNKVSNVDMNQCIDFVNSQGLRYYDWNVSSGDATSNAYTPDQLIANVMQDVLKYKTSVVLCHDAEAKATTVQALPKMIESLQAAGAEILPITDSTPLVQHTKR